MFLYRRNKKAGIKDFLGGTLIAIIAFTIVAVIIYQINLNAESKSADEI